MATTVTVREESFPAGATTELTLEFLTERVSVREIIRARVYQAVTELNAARAWDPRPAMPVTDTERRLNPERPPARLDWEAQYARALRAFERNGFLVLVDDEQVDDLDAEVELRPDTRLTFLRLVPLAGG